MVIATPNKAVALIVLFTNDMDSENLSLSFTAFYSDMSFTAL